MTNILANETLILIVTFAAILASSFLLDRFDVLVDDRAKDAGIEPLQDRPRRASPVAHGVRLVDESAV